MNVSRTSVQGLTVNKLRDAILTGHFKPGELVKVMHRFPAPPAPYIMFTVATSLTACTNTPSRWGSTLAIISAPSVEGVMG